MPQYIVAHTSKEGLAQLAQTTCSSNDVVGRALFGCFANELAWFLEVRDEFVVDLLRGGKIETMWGFIIYICLYTIYMYQYIMHFSLSF